MAGITLANTNLNVPQSSTLTDAVVYQESRPWLPATILFNNVGIGNGFCTDLVRYYRTDNFVGDAKTWLRQARELGYGIGNIPMAGSIYISTKGIYGHVAYVLEVYPDSFKVVEQNVKGKWIVSERIVQMAENQQFIY